MAAATGGRCSSLLRGLLSLFFLLSFIHIGHASCCFSPAARPREEEDAGSDGVRGGNKRRKVSPLGFSPAASSSSAVPDERVVRGRRGQASSLTSSLRFYLHRIFSSAGAKNGAVAAREVEEAVTTTVSSPNARSLAPQPSAPLVLSAPSSPRSSRSHGVTTPVPSSPQKLLQQASRTKSSSRSFAARGDVFPCKACGEVMDDRPQQLELHQALKLSHLDSSSTNIIRMIFLAGWKSGAGAVPAVRRVLKIQHNPRALARFEEYRDLVRARAGLRSVVEERCIADGNERLRFHCSTMLCSQQLGSAGGACGSPYCRVCSTLRHGFAGKLQTDDVDGVVATYASAWAAHASLQPEDDVDREFAFLQVRRAMLVCRVVAGRVGRGAVPADDNVAYDSVVPVRAGGGGGGDDVELLVFNPRAVLPCFVIIYGS